MKRVVFIIFLLIIIFSCVTTEESSKEESYLPSLTEGQRIEKSRELAKEARHNIDQDNAGKALDLANEAIELDPENCEALIIKGRAYRRFGKIKSAITSLETALNYCIRLSEPLLHLAECYKESGDIGKAKEYIEKAVNIAPDDCWANREMGNLYTYNNDMIDAESALHHYSIAIDNGCEDPWLFYDISMAYEKSGNREKAIEFIHLAQELIDNGQGDKWVTKRVAERLAELK